MSGSRKLRSIDLGLVRPASAPAAPPVDEDAAARFIAGDSVTPPAPVDHGPESSAESRLRKRSPGRSTTVYLPHADVARLRAIAFDENRSVTDVVTEAVVAFLAARGP